MDSYTVPGQFVGVRYPPDAVSDSASDSIEGQLPLHKLTGLLSDCTAFPLSCLCEISMQKEKRPQHHLTAGRKGSRHSCLSRDALYHSARVSNW